MTCEKNWLLLTCIWGRSLDRLWSFYAVWSRQRSTQLLQTIRKMPQLHHSQTRVHTPHDFCNSRIAKEAMSKQSELRYLSVLQEPFQSFQWDMAQTAVFMLSHRKNKQTNKKLYENLLLLVVRKGCLNIMSCQSKMKHFCLISKDRVKTVPVLRTLKSSNSSIQSWK